MPRCGRYFSRLLNAVAEVLVPKGDRLPVQSLLGTVWSSERHRRGAEHCADHRAFEAQAW
jgi:hypothetical protein